MNYTVRLVEFGDTVTMETGERYRAVDSQGKTAVFFIRPKDSVDVWQSGDETSMRAFGGKVFKVKRV